MTALVIGFVTRYLPNFFKWVGGKISEKQDLAAEEKMIRLRDELDRKRNAAQGQQAIASAEITLAITNLQSEIESLRIAAEDKASARKYGVKAISLMDATLAKGKDLGVHWGFLVFGWYMVLFVEMLSAIVQPMIATTVFAMWVYTKIKTAGPLTWGVEDWALMEAIVGFYLAGRVQKGVEAAKHTGAGEDAAQ